MDMAAGLFEYFFFSVEGLIRLVVLVLMVYYLLKTSRKKYEYIGLEHSYIENEVLGKQKRVYKTEEICRKIFEDYFGVPFEKCRPDFLRNPLTGKCLELDGYNPDIKTKIGKGLAYEYNGEQHYKYVSHFHKNNGNFIGQLKRDSFKYRKCREKGIALIVIPYYVGENLKKYIHEKIRSLCN